MYNFNKFNKTVDRLSCVNRFSSNKLSKDENVLEHTGKVALLCYHIGMSLSHEEFDIDIERLLSKALLHDIEESVTGDIIRTTKYATPEIVRAFKDGEVAIAERLLNDQFHDEQAFEMWKVSKSGATGDIVAFVDVLCAMYKMDDEINVRGNKSVANTISDTSVDTLRIKFKAMESHFPESDTMKELYEESLLLCQSLGLLGSNSRFGETL